MPTYYHYPSLNNQVEVKVFPIEWWRKLPLLKKIPYFVGNPIQLKCTVTKLSEDIKVDYWKSIQFFEIIPGREPHFFYAGIDLSEKDSIEIKFRSKYPVSLKGDVEYGFCVNEDIESGPPLFSADVVSNENIWLFIFGVIFTLLATFICNYIIETFFYKYF